MAITNDPSTNPVSQSTTQDPKINLNDVNPVKSTEENLDFDINLDDATTEKDTNEIDINKETIVPETKTAKIEDTCLDFPDSCFAKKPEVKTEESIPTPVVSEEEQNDDTASRLQEQDQQNKKEEESLLSGPFKELDINAEQKNDLTSVSKNNTNKLEPTINIDLNQNKSDGFSAENTDYVSDMKIIENMNGTKPIEQNNPLYNISEEKKEEPKSKSIDIDSLIAANENTGNTETQNEVNKEVTKSNDLYPDLNNSEVIAAATININSDVNGAGLSGSNGIKKANHLLKFLLPAGGVVILAILFYFVWATMYPMESSNIIPDEIPQVTEVEQTGLIEELTGEDMAIIEGTGVIEGADAIAATENINAVESHGASPDSFDSLGELTDSMASQGQIEEQSIVVKLTAMVNEANSFLAEGQSTNNKIYIKYGTVIGKKCTDFISTLESGQEIDNLEGNLAQLEGYLQKLRDIRNAGNIQTSGLLQETNQPGTQSSTNSINNAGSAISE